MSPNLRCNRYRDGGGCRRKRQERVSGGGGGDGGNRDVEVYKNCSQMPVMTAPSRTVWTRFTANKASRLTVRDVRLTGRTRLVRNNVLRLGGPIWRTETKLG